MRKNLKLFIVLIVFNMAISIKLKAQTTIPWILGGNGTINPSTDYLGTSGSDDLSIRTSGLDRLRILSTGEVGLGTTSPLSLFHMHQAASSTATDFKMTNAGSGSGATDGFKINLLSSGRTEFRSFENEFIDFYTNNHNVLTTDLRMRIAKDVLGSREVTRVAIAENAISFNFQPMPKTLLQLGQSVLTALPDGHRDWMDVGTYATAGTDYVYIGLKNELNFPTNLWTDHMDAVIGWGDNDVFTDNFNDLRFIFTAPPSVGGIISSTDGRETMRLSAGGNVGIGDFYIPGQPPATNSIHPARRLEVLDGLLDQPQLRLTYTQENGVGTGVYTDFQTTFNGDYLSILI